MKTLIISAIMILGLAATNSGKPILNIYSEKDPIIIDEEAYIDDIPFNTWEIAVNAITEGDDTRLDEESYIDDIPFDTKAIANQYQLHKFQHETGEANVNDIPFNTKKIMVEELSSRLTEQYRNEPNTCDLPEEFVEVRNFRRNDTMIVF